MAAGLGIALFTAHEMRSSWIQAWVLSKEAARLTYTVAAGASPSIYYPKAGPYDQRLGYSKLPQFLSRLEGAGYLIKEQARDSRFSAAAAHLGIYPIYREKNQVGLEISGRNNQILYSFNDPQRVYANFDSIPPIVVRTLLFIENRHMLDAREPFHNPAIEWDRLAHATINFGVHKLDRHRSVIGGSTLATQLEKMRHSPEGRTHSPVEKLRQIASASLRIYQNGPRTLKAQQDVIRDYMNSIPLAAMRSQGEVTGLGDGLAAWYGADFSEVNRLLSATGEAALSTQEMNHRAQAYREVLSLFIALREPSRYLVRDPAALASETDRYLRALYQGGVISWRLRDAALAQRLVLRPEKEAAPAKNFVASKAPQAIRMRLLKLLDLPRTYVLDRLDLKVQTTIDQPAQQSVTRFLQHIADPQQARNAGLIGDQLLSGANPANVTYSFTLYERGNHVNLLRVQTDNFNQPLNINEGTRLQLGSTAKLRTLINYLQIVEQLHAKYAGFTPAQLAATNVLPGDRLTAWAVQYLSTAKDRSLDAMLSAGLDRTYSGNPGEVFFTAGGQHRFVNFEKSENFRQWTVRDGFEQSVNLVFVRLMRDIEGYYKWRVPGASPSVLTDPEDPGRIRYLQRFADEEGSVFLTRFYDKYRGESPDQALDTLASGVRPTPWRIAVIYRSVKPQASIEAFSDFLKKHVPAALLEDQDLQKLYVKYGPDKFNLADRGYLAHVHPLELWLVAYLNQHPEATLSEALANSAPQRQEVYKWLFRPKERRGQDLRIGIVLEEDAFHEIWKAWKQLGYPFDSLVPSYATSIGVSGDTPKALAELAGIIVNDGMRYPVQSIRKLRFAQSTPMETVVAANPGDGQRVLSPDIVGLVRGAMLGVVQNGTGRRALGAFVLPNGEVIPVGGKTGTGDNRFKTFGAGGQIKSDRAVNRTAAFVFFVGDRLFGTVTAFVPSESAEGYKFTSALAVQVLKDLAPKLIPLVGDSNFPVVASAAPVSVK